MNHMARPQPTERVETLNDDADQYLVFSKDDYNYEQDRVRRRWHWVVGDIAAAQYDTIGRVLAFNVTEGTCRDVTHDIAEEVREHLLTMGNLASPTVRNFIEDHLGAHAADCVTEFA